jgi:hypothetical protein
MEKWCNSKPFTIPQKLPFPRKYPFITWPQAIISYIVKMEIMKR